MGRKNYVLATCLPMHVLKKQLKDEAPENVEQSARNPSLVSSQSPDTRISVDIVFPTLDINIDR